MVIYKGLQDRSDRQAVPLPFSNRGGILFNPSAVQIDCLYGIDGATYHLNYVQPNPPGCSKSFCSPNNNHGCGFNGAPATAWAPRDMQRLLELHKEHGAQWHNPGWHSGYNEVIVNSRHYNDHLPNSVWAFFYPKGQDPTTYASALAIPFKEAERMLQEATSETAVEVLPRVFLGNAASSANLIGLQRAGTTHVVNATATLPNHFEGTLSYLRLPLNDSLDDDLTPHLERACRFMSEALEHGGSVLVHCQQGVSRSASVVLAFCVRECGMELDAAKEMVHRLRWIWPNEAFKQQLRQFEAHVLAVSGTITGVETAVPSAIAPSAALSKTAPPALALDRTLSGNSSVAEGSWSDDE